MEEVYQEAEVVGSCEMAEVVYQDQGNGDRGGGVLVLVRHGKTEWNATGRFSGWADVGLNQQGRREAAAVGHLLSEHDFYPEDAFCSRLQRSRDTLDLVLENLGGRREASKTVRHPPAWELNERHYGALTALVKKQAADQFGEQQLREWRRGYRVRPPEMHESHPWYELIYEGGTYDDASERRPRLVGGRVSSSVASSFGSPFSRRLSRSSLASRHTGRRRSPFLLEKVIDQLSWSSLGKGRTRVGLAERKGRATRSLRELARYTTRHPAPVSTVGARLRQAADGRVPRRLRGARGQVRRGAGLAARRDGTSRDHRRARQGPQRLGASFDVSCNVE